MKTFPNISEAMDLCGDEAYTASKKFARFNSAHEGFAVLLEEVEELKAEVFTNPAKGIDKFNTPAIESARIAHRTRMRKEAIQVGAMALRFLTDLCPIEGAVVDDTEDEQ